jgi:hypothetical protein
MMALFSVGDRVWARRNVDTEPELCTIMAEKYPFYTVKPEDGTPEFECLQHWVRNHWEEPH